MSGLARDSCLGYDLDKSSNNIYARGSFGSGDCESGAGREGKAMPWDCVEAAQGTLWEGAMPYSSETMSQAL